MSETETWMPVFALMESAEVKTAAHPTQARNSTYLPPTSHSKSPGGVWRRVGTARKSKDGSWTIELVSAAPGGRLVIRPASPGESANFTTPSPA